MRKLFLILFLTLALAPCALAGSPSMLQLAGGGVSSGATATYGAELATGSNATDDLGGSEADAVSPWADGSTCAEFISTNTAPSVGTYHISGTANSSSDRIYRTSAGTTASKLYRIKFDVRHSGTGGNWICYNAWGAFGANRLLATITSANTSYQTLTDYASYAGTLFNTTRCASASTDGTIYIDNYSVKELTPVLGPELMSGNAAAPGDGEANSTSGWATDGAVSSVETDPQDGSYHIRFLANGNAQSAYYDLSTILTNGKNYLFSVRVKKISSDAPTIGPNGSTKGVSSRHFHYGPSAWEHHMYIVENFSSDYRYFVINEAGVNDNVDVYLDNFSIKEVLDY